MALGSSGITVSLVKAALGYNNTNIGGLCSNRNVNVWSKWKPIHSSETTLTIDILKTANYGISILLSNSVTSLYNNVVANGNLGYTYIRPFGGVFSPFRLGDFRNYDHSAEVPLHTSYKDGETIYIGGVTSSNHSIYKKHLQGEELVDDESSTYLTKNDIYPDSKTLKRGALVTDGTNTYWSTDYIPWAETNWQKFKGKTVTVFEFLTNVDNNPENVYTANDTDVFFALPEPITTITVSESAPAGSKTVMCLCDCLFTDSTCTEIVYSVRWSAVGDVYRGATIQNVHIGYYKDEKGTETITSTKIADSITVANETTTEEYIGMLGNPEALQNGYILVFWDNSIQHTTLVMLLIIEQ